MSVFQHHFQSGLKESLNKKFRLAINKALVMIIIVALLRFRSATISHIGGWMYVVSSNHVPRASPKYLVQQVRHVKYDVGNTRYLNVSRTRNYGGRILCSCGMEEYCYSTNRFQFCKVASTVGHLCTLCPEAASVIWGLRSQNALECLAEIPSYC